MKAYIFGPIHLFGKAYLPIYKRLTKLCKKYFDVVIGTWPDFWNSKETPRRFYDRTYKTIIDADLYICDVTSPSIGVGMEMQMGQEHNIPTIAVCKKGVKPSIMATGIPSTKKVIYYENIDDLSQKLEIEIKDFIKKRNT